MGAWTMRNHGCRRERGLPEARLATVSKLRGAKKDLVKEKVLGLVTRHHPGALWSLLDLSGNDPDKTNAEKSL